MARKQGSSLNFQQNELLNPRAQNLASAPGGAVSGQFWFNSTSGRFEYRGNSGTIEPTERATHSGTQAAATISDFDTAARAAAASADLPMGGNTLTGIRDAISAQEPATLAQLQSVQNGTDWKESVRAATTANITLSGLQTIDGVSIGAGERVLVKDQSSASANGIYLAASGAWTRALDAVAGKLSANAAVFVEEGSTQADTQWRLTTNNPITVGTTALAFAQIGAGSSYTAGTGIGIAGNVISIDPAVGVRKYAALVGGSTSIAVTHNLGTRDVTVAVYDAAAYDEIDCDVVHTDANTVTLGFSVAPGASSLRCVVHG
jgi:hypothetical protein